MKKVFWFLSFCFVGAGLAILFSSWIDHGTPIFKLTVTWFSYLQDPRFRLGIFYFFAAILCLVMSERT